MTVTAPNSSLQSASVPCRMFAEELLLARENVARDAGLLEIAPALRFCRYPVSALLGAHEHAAIAVRGDYCREKSIEVVRRPTGGGTLYLDPSQLCWALALPEDHPVNVGGLAGILEQHGRAIVSALRHLGVAARFVFPNDIEVQGRKIGNGFAGRLGDRILVQGSLLITPPDAESMLKILRVPTEKLSHEGVLSARQRLVSVEEMTGSTPDVAWIREILSQEFAEAFGLRLVPTAELEIPQSRPADPAENVPSPNAMKAFVKTEGGAIYLAIESDPQGRLTQASFSGTVQFAPSDLFVRLGVGLRGCLLQDCGKALLRTIETTLEIDLLGFGVGDLQRLVALATARQEQGVRFGLDREQTNTLIVHNPHGEDAAQILERATVMLVPYCAKLADCKFRFRDGCSECGMCEVGDAYAMARERGLRVVSITNFEHLQETLEGMRADEVPAYVGMCCENFYLKRHYAFDAAGIPAVLTDITGTTCYELREEDLAYAGRFRAEAHLKLDVVEKVMRFVPRLPDADTGVVSAATPGS